MPRYIVESTHTFATPEMENREYFSTNDAWINAAADYSSSDAGLECAPTYREDIVLLVDHASKGTGTVTLSTGEVITVKMVDSHE